MSLVSAQTQPSPDGRRSGTYHVAYGFFSSSEVLPSANSGLNRSPIRIKLGLVGDIGFDNHFASVGNGASWRSSLPGFGMSWFRVTILYDAFSKLIEVGAVQQNMLGTENVHEKYRLPFDGHKACRNWSPQIPPPAGGDYSSALNDDSY